METGDSPPVDLAFWNNFLIVSNGLDGISIFNIIDPAVLILFDMIKTMGYAGDLSIVGSELFYADGSSGIGVFDLSSLSPTPLPVSLVMLFTGVVGLAWARRRTA